MKQVATFLFQAFPPRGNAVEQVAFVIGRPSKSRRIIHPIRFFVTTATPAESKRQRPEASCCTPWRIPMRARRVFMLRDAHLQSCIDDCTRCHATCTETIAYSLEKSGRFAAASHILLLLDCAQMCATSTDFMLRGSQLHAYSCGVCAEVCERCARSCEEIGGGDAQLRECAETCRRCAASCREMSRHTIAA